MCLVIFLIDKPESKSKPQIPKSQIQRGKGKFGLLAVKIQVDSKTVDRFKENIIK